MKERPVRLWKEMGAALAVLSIYLLTLLVPLHQAAALQSRFADLGYETVGALSICTAISESGTEDDAPSAFACPVTGLAKAEVALANGGPALAAPAAFTAIVYRLFDAGISFSARWIAQSPRAPPVAV